MPRYAPFQPLSSNARAVSLARTLANRDGDIWVFAYGSLMWSSDFPVAEQRKATLARYRRAFCVWTKHARGTPENPGLGLGLIHANTDRCEGLALRLDGQRQMTDLERLWEREMWTDVYTPVWRSLPTERGVVDAIVFEVNRASNQFAGEMSPSEAARYIARASGVFGSCREYLIKTVSALQANGLDTGDLAELLELVEAQLIRC